jgi:hypothetical protein
VIVVARKVNPVLAKAREEGYKLGFKVGIEQGQNAACYFFADKFEGLEKVKGIGPKTIELIVNHFGREYFQEVKNESKVRTTKE